MVIVMFKKIPASKKSIEMRRKKYGAGINDADYMTQIEVNGKRYSCKIFSAWSNMLKRSYCEKYHNQKPSYIDVEVCSEWLLFSSFEKWCLVNYIEGYHLDKDIKTKGNRVYSPENCLFVPPFINTVLSDSHAKRGDFPIGVSFNKSSGRYESYVKLNRKKKNLGLFNTPECAHLAYKKAKNKVIEQAMFDYPEFAKYLHQHMYKI